jgi:formylglycine-generating enzyme
MKNHRQTFIDNPLVFTMIAIKGGTFDMGSNDYDDEKPIHTVRLSDYWIGEYPVTQALWKWVMKDTDMTDPSGFKGQNRPVENVSWLDITKQFLPKLNEITIDLRPVGSLYGLPTEAQWEYAARGGIYWGNFPFKFSGSNKLNEVGWFDDNSLMQTKPVGLKTPNLLGLYDMSGNVSEWCFDWYSGFLNIEESSSIDTLNDIFVNPKGVIVGYYRIYRGGCYARRLVPCSSSYRDDNSPKYRDDEIGFRLTLTYPLV